MEIRKFDLAPGLPDDDPALGVALGWKRMIDVYERHWTVVNGVITAAVGDRIKDPHTNYSEAVGKKIAAAVPALTMACRGLGDALEAVRDWRISWRQFAPGDIMYSSASIDSYGISSTALKPEVEANNRPELSGYVCGTWIGATVASGTITAFIEVGKEPATEGQLVAMDHMHEIQLTPPE